MMSSGLLFMHAMQPTTPPASSSPVWQPDAARRDASRIAEFGAWLERERGLRFADYAALWQWSVDDLDGFWQAIWDWAQIKAETPPSAALADAAMPHAQWFPGARLNYVDQVFRHASADRPALIFGDESGAHAEIGWSELRRQVAALSATLRELGVVPGDRVAAYLPNVPQAVVAFLATACVGAVWSACAPDMGESAVLDRFRQIEPKVLIAAEGYRYGGRGFDRRDAIEALRGALPSVVHTIAVPLLGTEPAPLRGAIAWADACAADIPLRTEPVAFDHPLWIVYSSGTTGLPKPIVHGHGGIVVEQVKFGALHLDLSPGDRFHWYSSTGWIMWNLQVGGLLVGATICIYDGNPAYPDAGALWRFAERARVQFFGAGAAYYLACMKRGVEPRRHAALHALRALGSTGSPLPPQAYAWLLEKVGPLWINAISGGTDIASGFIAGVPTLPVYLGEMQCRCLGARVEAWDEAGRALYDEVGELVCSAPMPSMPLYFWNDVGDRRYHESYFDAFPGVWTHGDWLRITPHGGAVIYGRSDATINRHGIRMGTSEIYRVVEEFTEVLDSLVVDLEYLGRPSWMALFLVLRNNAELDAALQERVAERIRSALSARHVPDAMFAVSEVPRTMSGKKMEVPVKKILLGREPSSVANPETMANPASLDWYIKFADRLQRESEGAATGAR